MDLGLPSGTLWAKQNLGANSPEDAGLYFSWGNIDGHNKNEGYNFSLNVYQTTIGATLENNIPLEQDAARVILGGSFRTPSSQNFEELRTNTSHRITTINEVPGMLFTSNFNGKSIFIPLTGFFNGEELQGNETSGHLWSTTFNSASRSLHLYLSSSDVVSVANEERRLGFNIRPIIEINPNRSIVPPTPENDTKDEETPTVEEPKDNNER